MARDRQNGESSQARQPLRRTERPHGAQAAARDPESLHDPLLPSGSRTKEQQAEHNVEYYSHFDWDEVTREGSVYFEGPGGFCTGVHSQAEDGSEDRWDARRHRRNLLPRRKNSDGSNLLPDRFNPFEVKTPYLRSDTLAYRQLRAVSGVVGPAFLLCAALFGLGSLCKEFPGYFEGSWSPQAQDWLVNWPYIVGISFYLVGAYCSILEAANTDYRHNVKLWQDGELTERPRLRLAPYPSTAHHDFLSFYGTFAQFLGGWLYALGAVMQLLATHVQLSSVAQMALVQLPFFVGAVGFVVGAYLMAAEATNSWWWALLPPPPGKQTWTDMGRWIQFITMVASYCYLIGAVITAFRASMHLSVWQLANGATYAFGAFLIFTQSVLQILEWYFPQL